jgi:pSer/pThr/pTyr-binding forkhead associated (FHA) protein
MGKGRRTTDVITVDKDPFGTPYVLALAVISGPDPNAIHRIVANETTVGASEEADFVLEDPRVSGKHFKIRINGHLYSLIDMGSTNGTMVNQNLVSANTPVRLKNFDEIQAGRTRFLFIANRFRND